MASRPDGIDLSVYPDVDQGEISIATEEDRADFVQRLCGGWDYGIPPRPETLRLLQDWRSAFDSFPLPHSPAYHALRLLYRWPATRGSSAGPLRWEIRDARERRLPDTSLA